MKKLMLAALLAACATAGHAADRIVAVVNDQVITSNQLDERVNLNLRQLGMGNPNPMQRGAVTKRTLSGLVDEELQRQYATKANIKLSKEEIAASKASALKAVGGEAAWASLTQGYEQSASDKLAAEALWQKIIARDLQPRVQVATSEADRLIAELAKSRHVLDREISVIQLAAGNDADGDKAQLDKLTKLKADMTGGETFADIARAYSEDRSAANGGNLGWFGSGELNPQLEEALDKMQPGQVSDPIRTPIGWYLVKLENVRTTKPIETDPQTQVDVYLLAAPTPADKGEAKDLEKAFDKTVKGLEETDEVQAYFKKAEFGKFSASRALGWLVQADLEKDLAKAIAGSKTGRWSDSVTVNGNVARIYVADTRQAMPEKLSAYRERVMNSIFSNRVELESRRFMQSLRQRAFLDVRL
ncbi:MAG: hypothetical protein EON60_02435 [Alphaproteobacteria bacterium]|nr:MAG: hypothetical protein EON60_02435 [Alphaproteobacteria bacterium]